MNKELKQQAHKEFEKLWVELGIIDTTSFEEIPALIQFGKLINSLIDKTVQMTEERIVGVIEEVTKNVIQSSHHPDQAWYDGIRCLKSSILEALITNKSDINSNK